MVVVKAEGPIGTNEGQSTSSPKVHPTERTNHADELQPAHVKKKNFWSKRENASFGKVKKAMNNSFFVSPAKKNSNEMNAPDIETKENLESRWRQFIVERMEKYQRHYIAFKLFSKESGGSRIN